MDIYRKQISLVILFLLSTHAVVQPYVGITSVLVKEGEMAEISCVTNAGSHSEYFWRTGESLHNSTEIAYFISGLPTDDSGPFKVTQNGTLILKKVTLDDEGKYICRVSSEKSDCHGEIFVFVQAALQDFQLTIEYCEPENSCVISTESTKPTSLTCKATNASPSMKLKWFNGSREIKNNIEENSLTKGTSKEISSTIKDVYKAPSTLTCQAVDFKTSNDDGMFAHVQFRTPASTADISLVWIVTAILFIVGFVILFLIVIVMRVWPKVRKGKDIETQNSAERESLLINLQTKDDELKTKSEEIKKLNKALLETQADKRVDESNSKDKEVQEKREQISKLEKSLETVTGKLLKTNEEHQKTATTQQLNLESKLLHVEKELTKTQNCEQEFSSKEEKLSERETKIKKQDDELNLKESTLAEREAETKKREDELNLKESTLAEREAETKKQLLDLERKTRKFRLDLMASKDPICFNCKLIASKTGDNARVATKEKGGQAKLKAKRRYDFNPKDAKFNTIYQTSAEQQDVCQSIVDFVENAIDGQNSCLITHDVSGREHWTTMFGPGKCASDALVPYAITKIFKRSTELRALDYTVDVTARFQTTSTEATNFESVKNEQNVLKLLKEGKIDQVDGSMDHFVQFVIKTKFAKETRTGTLILATIGSIQMIKECFHAKEPNSPLARNISEITSDGRCRSVLITHIHEDQVDETKDCLAMVNAISKKNKK